MNIKTFINLSLNLVLGAKCPICNNRLIAGHHPICLRCKTILFNEALPPAFRSKNIKAIWSCRNYSKEMKKAFNYFKFTNGLSMDSVFKKMIETMELSSQFSSSGIDIIIPVPIHPFKRLTRGYNQSELVAKMIYEITGVPFLTSILIKKKHTAAQKHLTRKQRIKNLKGSFLACKTKSIRGKNLLLVDDLITTGATLETCALELKKAGARNIYAFTLARVPLK